MPLRIETEDELLHYGKKGMKWGKRATKIIKNAYANADAKSKGRKKVRAEIKLKKAENDRVAAKEVSGRMRSITRESVNKRKNKIDSISKKKKQRVANDLKIINDFNRRVDEAHKKNIAKKKKKVKKYS